MKVYYQPLVRRKSLDFAYALMQLRKQVRRAKIPFEVTGFDVAPSSTLPGIRGFSRKGPILQYHDWVNQARSGPIMRISCLSKAMTVSINMLFLISINVLFVSSIFFIPCLQGVIYLMESSGQKRGRISSVVEASSSAPTPPKKEYDIKKISG